MGGLAGEVSAGRAEHEHGTSASVALRILEGSGWKGRTAQLPALPNAEDKLAHSRSLVLVN